MYFQGKGQEKILLCKGGGGYYMKNKNIGGCVLSAQPDQQKRPQCKKCAKNAKHYQTLKTFSSLVFFFLSSHHDTNPLLHLYHFSEKIYIG